MFSRQLAKLSKCANSSLITRGYVAYIAGIMVNVVGFAGEIGQEVPVGAKYIYNLNFFCGFIIASGIYYLLCHFFPVPATSEKWCEVGDELDDQLVLDRSASSDNFPERESVVPNKKAVDERV